MLSMNCIGVFIPPSTCFAEKLTHEENLIIVLATNKKRKIINNRVGRGRRGDLTTHGLLLNFLAGPCSGFFDFSTFIIFLRNEITLFTSCTIVSYSVLCKRSKWHNKQELCNFHYQKNI